MAKKINPTLHKVPLKKKQKRNKMNASKTMYNEVIYDSKKEAHYMMTLDLQRRAKDPKHRVVEVETQKRYDITMYSELEKKDVLICYYLLDFLVRYADGRIEYVDVKGAKKGCIYQHFKLKKKLVQAQHGITILEK